jgi:hypothetical protein
MPMIWLSEYFDIFMQNLLEQILREKSYFWHLLIVGGITISLLMTAINFRGDYTIILSLYLVEKR